MKSRLLFSVAFLLAAGIAASYWYWMPRHPNYTMVRDHSIIEMQPSTTQEWIEKHNVLADGTRVSTDVTYRNGETGTRFWRKNLTLSREIIRFADGRERRNAVLSPDGTQIVSGKEVRADGSLLWTASMDESNVVTTTTYWYTGKVFAKELRTVGSQDVDQWFYYLSGGKWQHFVGRRDGSTQPSIDQSWHEDGTQQFDHQLGLNETSVDSVFRDNGTLKFRQTWILRGGYSMGFGFTAPQRRMLIKVEVWSDDGTRIVRDYISEQGGFYMNRVVDHNADGTLVHYDMLYDGSVFAVTKVGADGKTISETRLDAKTTFRVTTPDDIRENYVDTISPARVWLDLETHPEKRPPAK